MGDRPSPRCRPVHGSWEERARWQGPELRRCGPGVIVAAGSLPAGDDRNIAERIRRHRCGGDAVATVAIRTGAGCPAPRASLRPVCGCRRAHRGTAPAPCRAGRARRRPRTGGWRRGGRHRRSVHGRHQVEFHAPATRPAIPMCGGELLAYFGHHRDDPGLGDAGRARTGAAGLHRRATEQAREGFGHLAAVGVLHADEENPLHRREHVARVSPRVCPAPRCGGCTARRPPGQTRSTTRTTPGCGWAG